MQLESKKDLAYVAAKSECEFGYMAVMDEDGHEVAITNDTIDKFYQKLLGERKVSHALNLVVSN